MKWTRVATLAAAVASVATSCTQVAPGVASWDADQATVPVADGDVADILVASDEVNEIVGSDLDEKLNLTQPYDQSGYKKCDQLLGAGLGGYLGDQWEGFQYVMASDRTEEDSVDNVVGQSAAVYPDAEAARDAYDDLNNDNLDCDGEDIVADDTEWTQIVDDDPADGVAVWTTEQTNSVEPWLCSGHAEVRNNVLLRAYVCVDGDDGPELAEEMIAAMAAAVWERSAPS